MLPVTPPPMHGIQVHYENNKCYIDNRNANYLAIMGLCIAAFGVILLIIFGRCALHPHYCPGINYYKELIIGCICIFIGIVSCFFLFDKSCLVVSDKDIEFWKRGKCIRRFPRDILQLEIVVELGVENPRSHTCLYNIIFRDSEDRETKIFKHLYLNTADNLKDYIKQLIEQE